MAQSKKYQVYIKPNAQGLAAQKAVNRINNQLGANVVKIVTNRKKADVVVTGASGKNIPGAHGGWTSIGAKKDRIQIARRTVNADNPIGRAVGRRVLEHEIGHGLGLGHVSGAKNLMNTKSGLSQLSKAQVKKVRQTKKRGGYK